MSDAKPSSVVSLIYYIVKTEESASNWWEKKSLSFKSFSLEIPLFKQLLEVGSFSNFRLSPNRNIFKHLALENTPPTDVGKWPGI